MRLIFGGLALVAGHGAAWAADNDPVMPRADLSGYVDLHLGYGWGNESGTFDDGAFSFEENWQEAVLGGAGRGVVPLTPHLSFQFDIWTNTFMGASTGEDPSSMTSPAPTLALAAT